MLTATRRATRIAFCLLLGGALASFAQAAEPDPHEMYKLAGEQMRSGKVKSAAAEAARLREFITRHPEWDPDGVYAQELLPSMEARLRRLQAAARELEQFTDRALRETKPPRVEEGQNASRVFGDWAASTLDALRRERDGLIATGLPSSEDQAILLRTESYARSQHLLDDDILRMVNEGVTHTVETLLPQDQRLETVHDRLDQIKKGMMESVVERDRLRRQIESLQARSDAYEAALIGLVFDDSGPLPKADSPAGSDLRAAFAALLDRELEASKARKSQTRQEYVARRASLERYRHCNRILKQAGVIEDQSSRIASLAEAVERTPRQEPARKFTALSGGVVGALAGILTAVALGFAQAAARRRRNAATFARPVTATPRRVSDFPHGQDGTHAA